MVFPGASAYQISKAAVSRLTEFVDLEYGKEGVNCVAMHPGGVLTEMSKKNAAIRDCKFGILWIGERGEMLIMTNSYD